MTTASAETLMQLNKLISSLTREDLAMVSESIYNRLQIMNQSAFKIGDKVKFDAKTRGIKEGVVIRKSKKTIQVLVGATTWKVSPSLLRKVA
jgi:hypothetical protein